MKAKLSTVLFLILLYWLQTSTAVCGQFELTTEIPNKLYLAKYFSVFETSDLEMPISQVVKQTFIQQDKPKTLNFGPQTAYWFHVRLNNNSPYQQFVLESAKPGIDEISVYLFDESTLLNQMTAYKNLIAETSDVNTPLVHFDLNLKENKTYDLYIKVRSKNRISERFLLYKKDNYFQTTLKKMQVAGVFYGMFGIILIITLSMALVTKEISFFLYSGFISIIAVIIAGEMGHYNYYFSDTFINTAIVVDFLKPLALLIFIIFSIFYLRIKQYFPRINKLLVVSAWLLAILYVLMMILKSSLLLNLINIMIVIFIITCIIVGSMRAIKKDIPAIFFVISWGFFGLGQILWLCTYYYIFEPQFSNSNFFLQYGALWGSLAEMVTMSIGLGFRTYSNFTMARQGLDSKNLIRVLSHDIATPLSIVAGTAKMQLRRADQMDDKMLKGWTAVSKASDSMTKILEHVRTQDAILSGKQNVELEFVNISEAVNELDSMFYDRLKDKHITVEKQISPDIYVLAHKHALTYEVIANLISNAIKFTNEGGKIELRTKSVGTKNILEIINYGTIIPKSTIPSLFSPFLSTTTVGTKGERGTGFGLPLVKAYMDRFKAKIEVTSELVDKTGLARTTFSLIFTSKK